MLANIHGSVNKIDENLPFQNLLSMLLFFYENIFLTKLFYSHISKISTLRFFFLDRFQIIFYHWNIFHGLNILTKLYKLINGTVLTVLVSFTKSFAMYIRFKILKKKKKSVSFTQTKFLLDYVLSSWLKRSMNATRLFEKKQVIHELFSSLDRWLHEYNCILYTKW